MKSKYLRESRANGSTHRKVAKLIQLGWYPGCNVRLLLRKARRKSPAPQPMEAATSES